MIVFERHTTKSVDLALSDNLMRRLSAYTNGMVARYVLLTVKIWR